MPWSELAGLIVVFSFVIGGPILFLVRHYQNILKDPNLKDFAKLKSQLGNNENRFKTLYTDFMNGALQRTDRFFENKSQNLEGLATLNPWGPKPWPPNPWSVRTYRRCMIMALIYPIAAAFFAWGLSGEAGPLGTQLGLEEGTDSLQRGLAVASFIAMSVAVIALNLATTQKAQSLSLVAIAVAFAGAVAIAGAFAVAGAVAIAFAVAGAVAGAGAIAVAIAFAFAFAFAGAFTGAGAIAFAVAGTFTGTVAIAFAVIIIEFYAEKQQKPWLLSLFWAALTAMGLCAAGLTVQATAGPDIPKDTYVLLVAFVLLPFLNGPFDWLSVGLTRGLLRQSLVTTSPYLRLPLAFADFMLALLAVALLAGTMIFCLEFINGIGQANGLPESGIADVKGTLAHIRAAPNSGSNLWIYFTVLSTLIPTLLHLCIFIASLLHAHPQRLNRWAYKNMDTAKDGSNTVFWIAAALTTRWVVSVALTLGLAALIGYGLFFLSSLGWCILEGLEGLQRLAAETFRPVLGAEPNLTISI